MHTQDTTSAALQWFFVMFSNRPDLQDKIIEEVDQVLPDLREPDYADIQQLVFLEAVRVG